MNKISIEELQENFDEYIHKVKSGKSFIITSQYGNVILTQPTKNNDKSENIIEMYTNHDEGC